MERYCIEWWNASSTRPELRTHRDLLGIKELRAAHQAAVQPLATSTKRSWLAKARQSTRQNFSVAH
eukprot:3209867-Pyramimonas_sp.AAC.1